MRDRVERLHATQGFLGSVVQLMDVELPIPDYSTVSRRQGGLEPELRPAPASVPRPVAIDSTGLKVYGVGEWYLRKHGMRRGRRRIWRKLHLGVDETTKEIVAVDLTTSQIHDSHQLPDLLDRTPDDVAQVSGDKAYDCRGCYASILERGAEPTIPPRRRARLCRDAEPPLPKAARDRVLRRIAAHRRYNWRVTSGATRQSLAENAVSRFKALVGVKLTARTFENQRIEALVKCGVLNRVSVLGLPRSERIQLG